MKKQFITDDDGNKIAVIIPIEEYNRLIEKSEKNNIVQEEQEAYVKTYILTKQQEKELNRRYEYVLKNPENGKIWEEIKNNLLLK